MENNNSNNSFLGRGWSFPPTFIKSSGSVITTEDEEDIRKSLEILLSTSLGERIMQPKFGCDLRNLSFEALNNSIKTYMKDLIKTAILYHEPRIKVLSIELDTKDQLEGIIYIHVDYTIRITNTRSNMVYPYFLNEATSI